MSAGYRAVQWNAHKRVYDQVLAGAVFAYLLIFFGLGKLAPQPLSDVILVIRATGSCAFLMLHVVLAIGPLCRWQPRFLPLLYNRRHLGVSLFLVAFVHALLVLGFYHGFGVLDPATSLLTAGDQIASPAHIPFEWYGAGALLVLYFMASTSHDFWLNLLTPPLWKALHMGVYGAYFLLVLHVCMGVLQWETHPIYAAATLAGMLAIGGLHVAAGLRETRLDAGRANPGSPGDEWIDLGDPMLIPDGRARVVCLPGRERVAVFRHDGKVSAISNVCAHQNGPLGEGRVIDGCVTCPWHGYQYQPHNGTAPPPFTEKLPTFRVRIRAGRLELHPQPLPPGTAVPPAELHALGSRP